MVAPGIFIIVVFALAEQPLHETVTVYVLAAILVKTCVVCSGIVFHLYEYIPEQPETIADAVPFDKSQYSLVADIFTDKDTTFT